MCVCSRVCIILCVLSMCDCVNVTVTVSVTVCLCVWLDSLLSNTSASKRSTWFSAAVFFNVQLQTGRMLAQLEKSYPVGIARIFEGPAHCRPIPIGNATPVQTRSPASATASLSQGGGFQASGSEFSLFRTCLLFCWHSALEPMKHGSAQGTRAAEGDTQTIGVIASNEGGARWDYTPLYTQSICKWEQLIVLGKVASLLYL